MQSNWNVTFIKPIIINKDGNKHNLWCHWWGTLTERNINYVMSSWGGKCWKTGFLISCLLYKCSLACLNHCLNEQAAPLLYQCFCVSCNIQQKKSQSDGHQNVASSSEVGSEGRCQNFWSRPTREVLHGHLASFECILINRYVSYVHSPIVYGGSVRSDTRRTASG